MSSQAGVLPPGVEAGSLGKRFVSYLIDALPPALLSGVVAFLTYRGIVSDQTVLLVLMIASGIVVLGWAVLCWWLLATKGATVGMKLMKLQFVGLRNGRPVGWGSSLLRQIVLSLLVGTGIGIVGVIVSILINVRNQGWHDLAGKGVVIKERARTKKAGASSVAQDKPVQQQAPSGGATVGLPAHLQANANFTPGGQDWDSFAPASAPSAAEVYPQSQPSASGGYGAGPSSAASANPPAGQGWTPPGQGGPYSSSQAGPQQGPGYGQQTAPGNVAGQQWNQGQSSAPWNQQGQPGPGAQGGQPGGGAAPQSQHGLGQSGPGQQGPGQQGPAGPGGQRPGQSGWNQPTPQHNSSAPSSQASADGPPTLAAGTGFPGIPGQPPGPITSIPFATDLEQVGQPVPGQASDLPGQSGVPGQYGAAGGQGSQAGTSGTGQGQQHQNGSAAPADERALYGRPAGEDDFDDGTRIVARAGSRAPDQGWSIALDDGRFVKVASLVLIGRNPQPRSGEEHAELVQVGEGSRTVSKTHLAVGVDSRGIYVSDRGSTNGSAIANANGEYEPCAPGEIVRVREGQIVTFGEHRLEVQRAYS